MRKTDFRRIFHGAALASMIAIAGVTVPRMVTAQGAGEAGAAQTRTDDRDDGMDWGWLGLLGLAGLLGLRRRDHVHQADPMRRP